MKTKTDVDIAVLLNVANAIEKGFDLDVNIPTLIEKARGLVERVRELERQRDDYGECEESTNA